MGAHVHLLDDLTGGGEWLGEDGDFVGEGIGHGEEVVDGQGQVFGEGPVTAAADAY